MDKTEHLQSLQLRAEIAVNRDMLSEAIACYKEMIDLNPVEELYFYKRGNLFNRLNEFEAALSDYDSAIELSPVFAKALCNRGVVLERLGRLILARDSFDRAIAANAQDSLAHFNLASVLRKLNEPQRALTNYDRAILISPDYVEAFCNRGVLLAEMKRPDDAMASYEKAIEINPSFFLAHYYRGSLLSERRQWDAALASYSRVLEINPNHAETYCNRAALLTALRHWDVGFADARRALSLNPDLPEAHFALANLYSEISQVESALKHFDRALALKPDYADALHNKGNCYLGLKLFEAASASYEAAVAIKPGYQFILGTWLHAKMNICNWSNLKLEIEHLILGIEHGEAVSPPFPALALVESEVLHFKAAQLWVEKKYPLDSSLAPIAKRSKRDKIRLGYFSADFHEHPVAVLSAQLYETHDRTRFDVLGFSFGPDSRDAMRGRLKRAFDTFIDVSGKSDLEVALLARSLEVDIAIDLTGFTANNRAGVFALRAAPIQINYLGFSGTMGAEYVDYIIGDEIVIPQNSIEHYSEKIIYLPGSYLPNDTSREISDIKLSRQELGLPDSGFVFCCFNNSYKITPWIFSSWMRILTKAENSVLWLAQYDAMAADNLRQQATQHGVDEKRLIFAVRVNSAADHLSRLHAADLFLDTLPYNAHATAIDALWVGLPILTCIGRSFVGRVAASLLTAIGLPELIVSTLVEYEELAIKLVSNRQMLFEIRKRLAVNRLAKPLFDSGSFVAKLEVGYIEAFSNYRDEKAPEHIFVNQLAY